MKRIDSFNMRNRLLNIAVLILSNFFLLTLLTQLLYLIGIDLYIWQLMRVVFAVVGVYCMMNIRCTPFDVLIFIYIIYILINGVAIDYQNHGSYFYRAIIVQYFPIFTYFIGRYVQIDLGLFLSKMKYPLLFAMLCGIFFYIVEPGWYVMMKEAQLRVDANDYRIAEIYRLSSFWGHPYVIAYATLLYSLYLTHRIIIGIDKQKEQLIYIGFLVICCIVLFLAQMRVTIFFYLIAMSYMVFGTRRWLKKKNNVISIILILLVTAGVVFVLFTADESSYIIKHMQRLFEDDALSERFVHTLGGIVNYSFWGDGFGRYDMLARSFGKWAIVDQEFQNHIAELGYLGGSLLILILLFSVYRCYKNRFLLLENSVILFFVIAMVGASVLSNSSQYNYMFWYTLGLLWSKKYVSLKSKKCFYLRNNYRVFAKPS